jgi:hypothetical protein
MGMKKRYILVIIILLFGCQLSEPWEDFEYWFYHEETFTSTGEVLDWILENIEYQDDGVIRPPDYWKTPKQTYDSRKGDCEDFSLLAGYFLWELGYEDVRLVIVENVEGGGTHSIISLNGVWIEPQIGSQQLEEDMNTYFEKYSYIRSYSIKEALWATVTTHDDGPIYPK